MATIFQTFEQWRLSTVIYPAGDYLIALPGNNGYYYFKLANGTSPANRLPYAPNPAPFTQPLADGGITGPSTTTPGNLVTWTSSDGTTVGDGPAITDFATAAQGALADTAVQPGDPLADLSSSPATAGQVPEADGAGGITWVTPAGGSGITELTGPITAGPGTGSQATTVTPNAIDNTMLALMPSDTFKGNAAATPADPADLTADDASDILDTATDPFVRTSNLPASGDVVGPASSTDGSFPRWDGTTGKLLKDGVLPSTGGNGAADDGLVAVYGPEGQLHGSAQSGFNYAVEGTATFGATAGRFVAANGTGIEVSSVGGKGGVITTAADDIGLQVENDSSTTQPALEVTNLGTADIAHFEGPTGGVQVKTDGGLNWSSATGAQTTATALPVFGTSAKGVVPASGGGTTNFLRADGTFSTPPDTTGITQLTGDVTAGPGSGSQAATLANTAVTPASYTNANITVDSKGRITAASNGTDNTGITQLTGDATAGPGSGSQALTLATVNAGVGSFGSATATPVLTVNAKGLVTAASSSTVTPAVGSITGFGTGVATALAVNVGTAGAPVVNGGALGTPSSGTATNLTGTATGLSIGGNAATVTTNANLTGPITSVGNATTIADPELSAIAALTSAADKGIQYTGSGTAQLIDLKLGTESAYTGTPTFTAGAAPSGASSLRQFYTQIGNLVTWQIMLTYATTGTTVTNVVLTFPTQFPTPAIPTGFTGASVKIWPCPLIRCISTPSGNIVTSAGYGIYRNAADTGFEIAGVAFSSGSYRTFQFYGSYFTA